MSGAQRTGVSVRPGRRLDDAHPPPPALGAPLLVSVSALSLWLPWVVAAVMAVAGAVGVLALARHLPPSAVRP